MSDSPPLFAKKTRGVKQRITAHPLVASQHDGDVRLQKMSLNLASQASGLFYFVFFTFQRL